MPARRVRIDSNNLPPARNHFVDVALPERLWSPWRDGGIEQRMICRAMARVEEDSLKRRAAELVPALLPFARPDENDRVAKAMSALFDSYPSIRTAGTAVLARINNAIEVLSDLPAWAIEEACLMIRRRGYEVHENGRVRLEQHWPPSDGDVHAMATSLLATRREALASAQALLAAPVANSQPVLDPEAEARRAGKLADFRAQIDASRRALAEMGDRRRDEVGREQLARSREDRIAEYAKAGVEMPKFHSSVFVSLPMMLKMGWKIDGGRLIAPAWAPSHPATREVE